MAPVIQSVKRASDIYLYVAEHPRSHATEIANAFGLTLPTTHHLLSTLTLTGLLRKDADRRYQLGPASERVADLVLQQMRPSVELRAALNEVSNRTGESCYLTAWRGNHISIVAAIEGNQSVRVQGLVVGYSENIHARVGARVLLAYADDELRDWALAGHEYTAMTPNTVRSREELDAVLQQIRDTGLARDREQLQEGVYSLGAPIRIKGEVRAAISLTAPIERFKQNEADYINIIKECAELPQQLMDEQAAEAAQ